MMAEFAGTGNTDGFNAAKEPAQETLENACVAMDEYEQHLREHGC